MSFDFSQLVRDLQKIQVKLDEGFVEEAQEQLEFVIGEVNIAAQQNTKANEVDVCGFDGGEHDWGRTRCNKCHQPRR